MKEILSMTVPGEPEYIKITKMAVGSAAALEGFDVECIDDIRMAVGEACKNVTCHGHEGWSDCYQVVCTMDDNKMIIVVEDRTCKHSIRKMHRPCMDCPREGDLGLEMIKSIMQEVEVTKEKTGNKKIKMVKYVC